MEKKTSSALISSLVDNFEKNRIEIDLIKCQGPSFKKIQTVDLNLELLKQDLTSIIVLTPFAQAPLDVFYEKPLILYTSNQCPIQKPKTLSFKLARSLPSASKNQNIIIHNTIYWHELKAALRKYTSKELHFYLSEKDFQQFISEKTYSKQNLIQVMGNFFDKKTRLYVKKSSVLSQKPIVQWLEKEGKIQWIRK